MKKLLSIFLATAMLISLIPAVFAADTEAKAGIKVVYDFTNTEIIDTEVLKSSIDKSGKTVYELDPTVLTYAASNGFWEYEENSRGINPIKSSGTGIRINTDHCSFQVSANTAETNYWIALRLNVPKDGDYKVDIVVNPFGFAPTTYIDAFMFKVEGHKGTVEKGIIDTNKLNSDKTYLTENKVKNSVTLTESNPLEAGEYYFVFKPVATGSSSFVSLISLTLTEGDGSQSVPMISSLTSTTKNDVTTVTATAAKMSNGEDATDVTFSYAVATDDEDLASVDESTGVVTGLADDTATIIATATKDGLSSSKSIEVDVTAPVVVPTVTPEYDEAFGKGAYTTDIVTGLNPQVVAYLYTDSGKISVGTTAEDNDEDGLWNISTDETIDGYTFRYWARGLENAEKGNKRIVSIEKDFAYCPEKGKTNYLIAVYTKDGEVAETEYFNANGQLLPDATEETRPYMLGYGYATDWKDNGNGIKEAVYGNGVQSYNITVNGKADTYTYGTRIICPTVEEPEGKYFWGWTKKVGNAAAELVSTEMNYTFYAWEGCVVEPMFGDSELVCGDIIARKILISKLDIDSNESVIKAEFIGFDDAVERGITLDKDYAMTRDDAKQFAIINNVNATEISAYAILSDGTKYIYTYVAPTAE